MFFRTPSLIAPIFNILFAEAILLAKTPEYIFS